MTSPRPAISDPPSLVDTEIHGLRANAVQALVDQLNNAGPLDDRDRAMLKRLSDLQAVAAVRDACHREAVVVERAIASAAHRNLMSQLRQSAEAKLCRKLQDKHEKVAREQESRKRWGKRKREELKGKLERSLSKHRSRTFDLSTENNIEDATAAQQLQEKTICLLREVVQEAAQVAARRIRDAEEQAEWLREQAAHAAEQELRLEQIRQDHRERLARLEAQRQQEAEMRTRWDTLCEERARHVAHERLKPLLGVRKRPFFGRPRPRLHNGRNKMPRSARHGKLVSHHMLQQ
ncbi:hypothetical protein C8Q73DRAFT_667829 [Cubamyces lactineus]|nr:hypothetical protein C8Q73DRAFT_667829 [Cubamyces lactineus]